MAERLRISGEGKIGIGLALLALLGFGAEMIWPDHIEIGGAAMVIAVLGGISLAYHHFSEPWSNRRKIITAVGAAALSLAVIGVATRQFFAHPHRESTPLSKEDIEAAVHQDPRVTVTQIIPLSLTTADEVRMNVYFSNQGQSAVRDIKPHMGVAWASGALPTKFENQIFSNLNNQTHPSVGSGDLMEPGESRFSTFPADINDHSGIPRAKYLKYMSMGRSLYLFVDLEYIDKRDGSFWRTEYCEHFDFNLPKKMWPQMAPQKCLGHNGIIRFKP
jgi:hypothetical protein